MASITSPGIGSGLDVNGIVSKLMQVEQQPLALLDSKEAKYQSKLTAYGTLKGALSSFQTAAQAVNDVSKFQSASATVGDSSVFTATAQSNSVAGAYNINVTQLAQAQSLMAAGQSTTNTAIGSGATTTLTFQFGTISGGTFTNGVYTGAGFSQDGTSSTGTVTIDSSNNTLQGIRDAINAANVGANATIVNDGTSNRLVLTSKATGANSSMSISVSGDSTLANLLNYDPTQAAGSQTGQNLTQTVAAQSAALTVNGISITSASNSVSGAIDGVSLSLIKTGSTTLNVARDTSTAKKAIQDFVAAYNSLNGTISSLASYDATSKQGGILLGDSAVNSIQARIRGLLGSALTGVGGSYTTLSQVGVSFQKDGTLSLDTSKLQTALASKPDDVAALFSAYTKTSDSLVSYSSSSTKTIAGSYPLNVTQIATQATATGGVDISAGAVITKDVNDTLAVKLDGTTAIVTLTPGTYTASKLAAMVQAAINGNSNFSKASDSVAVTVSGNNLLFTSNRYGSGSNVSITGGTAQATIAGTTTDVAGVDVQGTIGGVTALGSGQYLTGAAGSAADGLKVRINGGNIGSRGNINYSHGFALQISDLMDTFLSSTGPLASRTDGINSSIKSIDDQRTTLNNRLADIEKRYRAQYTALDTLMSQMTSTSNYLTQQLASISASTSSK
ncbi:flagellar hook-associated protein 2 [Novimethylophilus kurashikiensis]|uniref:Flagellar hook-associated protein 2 n=1 Tax=Novimethylophilus kurashikiensis TaxID=1825523 RepID=A0A2R5F388_9PROT|nr:flagellar filament capping protein FliD [Novimethylophilus kurashikiensis]GBG13000.1 flagellar hook-associated protein 2 [Novimethylophilus kurashikiensis]